MANETDKIVEAEFIAQRFLDSCRPCLVQMIASLLPMTSTIEQPEMQHGDTKARIDAKEFLSVAEAAVLLECSDSHIRNLVDRARSKRAPVPIPFIDLDGVVRFQRLQLLEWRDKPKPRARKTGKNKTHLAAVQ